MVLMRTEAQEPLGRALWVATAAIMGLICFVPAEAQDSSPTSTPYARLLEEFDEQLAALSAWCDAEGLAQPSEITRQLRIDRDPGREYYFLPPAESPWPVPADGSAAAEWAARFAEIRCAHASRLFELALSQAREGRAASGFAMLHEVCTVDPDHADARRILGYQLREGEWRQSSGDIKQQLGRIPHSLMGWRPRDYLVFESPHYQVASTATPDETLELVQRLERWRVVWEQAFFDYWCSADRLQQWIDGKTRPISRDRHRVVFFANRDQYVRDLARLGVAGVEQSTGFYSDRHETMFFYQADPNPVDTWRQEQAHQLFQESASSRRDPVARSHVWALEGIAMFFESLVEFPHWATLGGFDHGRLQYARIHWQRERFLVPFEELALLGREGFQTHPQVAKLYSQSAGMTHFLMTAGNGKYRAGMMELVKAIYQRRAKPDSLPEICQTTYEALEKEYPSSLTVNCEQVRRFLFEPDRRTELALGFSDVDNSILPALLKCAQLHWLQLSSTRVDDAIAPALAQMIHLEQLFLDRTGVTDQVLVALAGLRELEELDLADTEITDDGLATIGQMKQMKALWLGGTKISDAGLKHLTSLTQLQMLDLRGTQVTAEAESRLRRQLPQLR